MRSNALEYYSKLQVTLQPRILERNMRAFFFFALAILLVSSPAQARSVCDELIAAIPKLSKGAPLIASANGQTYKSIYDLCDARDRFSGMPLPTHNGKRLTCSTDPNHVSYLIKHKDNTISFEAKAAVDADGSKFSCGSGWPNQCGTWLQFDKGSQRKDVNAEDTPFVVVPGAKSGISFQNDTGIGRGDLAVIFTKEKCSFGVVGDAGPYFRLGEISLKAHADLGHPRCRIPNQYPCKSIKESGLSKGVHYLIFPKSRPAPLMSQNVNDVSTKLAAERAKAFLKNLP